MLYRLYNEIKHGSHEATKIKLPDFKVVIQATLRKLRYNLLHNYIHCVSINAPALKRCSSEL